MASNVIEKRLVVLRDCVFDRDMVVAVQRDLTPVKVVSIAEGHGTPRDRTRITLCGRNSGVMFVTTETPVAEVVAAIRRAKHNG